MGDSRSPAAHLPSASLPSPPKPSKSECMLSRHALPSFLFIKAWAHASEQYSPGLDLNPFHEAPLSLAMLQEVW